MLQFVLFVVCLSVSRAQVESNVAGLLEPPGIVSDAADCICVPYYLCKDGEILTTGEGLIDIRFGGVQVCEGALDVCCRAPSEEGVVPTSQPYVAECGKRNEHGLAIRITYTEQESSLTQFGEFPWHVAILNEQYDELNKLVSVYTCGGSLIHDQVVLTAAHCVDKIATNTLKVRAGSWDVQQTDEPYEERQVAKVIIHPDFRPGYLHNDFALLFLNNPFTLQPHIDTVCLPQYNEQFQPGTICTATGWGKNAYGQEGNYQSILKKVDLPLVSHGECQRAMRNTRLGPFYHLHQSFRCAGGNPGEDTCQGDGGSALVCQDNTGHWQQVGIVAWGIGCGGDGIPGVYADVVQAADWIDANTAEYFNAILK